MINDLLQGLTGLSGTIRNNSAVNVNGQRIKQIAIDLGSSYFREYRSEVIGVLRDSDDLREYDDDWQGLIRLAHGSNPKRSYQQLLNKLIRVTKEINIASHSVVTAPPAIEASSLSYSRAERVLIETLENLLPSAAASYQQGIDDLNYIETRKSYRGTATELREAFRETLDHLAPDKEVMAETWFSLQANQTRPTRKQKVQYILKSRGKNRTQRRAAEKTVDLIEELAGDIARAVYDRASLSTHVETTKEEVGQLKRYMDAVLFDLLEIGQVGT